MLLAKPIRIISSEQKPLYNTPMSPDPSIALTYPFHAEMRIEGERPAKSDEMLCACIQKIGGLGGLPLPLFDWVHQVSYRFENIPQGGLTSKGLVRLRPTSLTEWTTVHELAHAWDASLDWQLSRKMQKFTHSYFLCRPLHKRFPAQKFFWYHVGNPPAPCGIDQNFNEKEDFAESVTAYLFPEEAHRKAIRKNASYESDGYTHFHETPRGRFIRSLVESRKTPS